MIIILAVVLGTTASLSRPCLDLLPLVVGSVAVMVTFSATILIGRFLCGLHLQAVVVFLVLRLTRFVIGLLIAAGLRMILYGLILLVTILGLRVTRFVVVDVTGVDVVDVTVLRMILYGLIFLVTMLGLGAACFVVPVVLVAGFCIILYSLNFLAGFLVLSVICLVIAVVTVDVVGSVELLRVVGPRVTIVVDVGIILLVVFLGLGLNVTIFVVGVVVVDDVVAVVLMNVNAAVVNEVILSCV